MRTPRACGARRGYFMAYFAGYACKICHKITKMEGILPPSREYYRHQGNIIAIIGVK
jgi:hypothetical protein